MPDRGDYRSIFCSFWDNADTHALSDGAYRVLTTLKGTLNAAGIGVVYLAQLAERCGKGGYDDLRAPLTELECPKDGEQYGWIRREKNVVWIVNGLFYEPSLTFNNSRHRTFVRDRCLAPLGDVPIVVSFRDYYPEWFTDSPRRALDSLKDGSRKAQGSLSKQNPIQSIPTLTIPIQPKPIQSSLNPSQSSENESATDELPAAAQFARAANRGITTRFGEQTLPLRHDAAGTLIFAETVENAGVTVAFAVDAIFTCLTENSIPSPPRSMTYFSKYVVERWAAHQAHEDSALSDAKLLPTPVGDRTDLTFSEVAARMQARGDA